MGDSDRARNRREAARLEEEALGLLPGQRPNEPPAPVIEALACPQSKYRAHRFLGKTADGLICCEFCGETLQAWKAKRDAEKRR